MHAIRLLSGADCGSNPPHFVLSHVEIHTDGTCEPNPGPGGYGAVLIHPKKRATASGGFRKTTNNRMEVLRRHCGAGIVEANL